MAEPRKIFRIEETAAAWREQCIDDAPAASRHAEIMQQFNALAATLTAAAARLADEVQAPPHVEVARLTSELNLIAGAIGGGSDIGGDERTLTGAGPGATAPMTRIAHELHAVVSGTEQATEKILAAAEEIDQAANNLSAALKGKIEQGLAQDIRDLVIRIFESCNFQDLIGQRVAKVLATLQVVEERIARVVEEIKNVSEATRRDGAQGLHGPRLDSDWGHASQGEVDAIFGTRR